MIVPVRQWTLVRPLRLAMRARRLQQTRSTEPREPRHNESIMRSFESMLEHHANLMLRDFTQK